MVKSSATDLFPLTGILAAVKVISLLLLGSALIEGSSNSCPSGWYHNKGFCYMVWYLQENSKFE
jgi:hypothetical protein